MSRLTGADAYGLMEAYNNVYAPQELTEEQVWEEVENWVNSLLEEGYDLSDYTWEEMYEAYANLNEGRTTSLSALSRESQKRKDDNKRGRPETKSEIDFRLAMGNFRPGASQEERAEGGRQVLKDRGKVPKKGGKDMFEHILEHLVAEGYADTNESALVIMANMSEEWREEILDEAAANQSNKQIEKGVKTTYKAKGTLANQASRGLNRLPSGERESKTKRMQGRLETRRDDLFGERNKREDESRAELKKKYGL
jgi:hypothetical protein